MLVDQCRPKQAPTERGNPLTNAQAILDFKLLFFPAIYDHFLLMPDAIYFFLSVFSY